MVADREVISQIQREEWELLLQNAPLAHYFQSPDYYCFLQQQDFLKPFLWGVRRDGLLRALVCGYVQADGGCVMRYFTRRAIILGGVLPGLDCNAEDLTFLMKHVVETLRHSVIYVEVRNFADYSTWKQPMQTAGFDYVPHYDAHVDATNVENMLQRMNKRRQRQIRAEQRKGHRWYESDNPDDFASFYAHLKGMYKNKIRRPLLPLSVLHKAWTSPCAHLVITRQGNELTGGVLCFKWGGVCYAWYEWGGMYTTWAGMEWASQQGCHLFDFMGAGEPNREYGVRDFKCSMGGELKEFGRFRYVSQPYLYALGRYFVTRSYKR